MDIAIIGSGAAATTTLIELFNSLIDGPVRKEKFNITIVEKYPEFFKGIPYGSRSSINALTITGTSDFVSVEKEKKLFQEWLKINHDEWTGYYRANGGLAAIAWLDQNLPLVEKSDWQIVYIPRFVFGIYMQERMLKLLKIVEQKELAKVKMVQAEAIDVKINEEGLYEVTLEYPDKKTGVIATPKLVIAVGSAPVKNSGGPANSDSFTYINDLYEPSAANNLTTLQHKLENTKVTADRNLLIIGSNASCIELLYLLNHRPDILANLNRIITISRKGSMPYYLSEEELDHYPSTNLDEVKTAGSYNVHTLVDAAKKDIALAIDDTVIIPHLNKIIGHTIELLNGLDEESKLIFFSIYGPQITKLIRRSGPAYKGASDNLVALEKLGFIKGTFLNIEEGVNGGVLNYTDADNKPQKCPVPFKVVINCTGSNKLQDSSSRLIYALVNNNICRLNLSGEGILVNERFEAAPNLYIIGPLLAGNVNKIIHFWHLENVSRLLYLAPYLAAELTK